MNFLYISEQDSSKEIREECKKIIKEKRDKTSSSVDWKIDINEPWVNEIKKCWWQPTNSKRKGQIQLRF